MDFSNLYERFFTSFILIIFFLIIINYFELLLPIIVALIYGIIIYEILFFFKKNKKIFIFLIFYILLSFICIEIYLINFYSKILFIYFVLIIASFDTTSYFLGSLYGKRKLFPKISLVR